MMIAHQCKIDLHVSTGLVVFWCIIVVIREVELINWDSYGTRYAFEPLGLIKRCTIRITAPAAHIINTVFLRFVSVCSLHIVYLFCSCSLQSPQIFISLLGEFFFHLFSSLSLNCFHSARSISLARNEKARKTHKTLCVERLYVNE